jgi:hypothetical protein
MRLDLEPGKIRVPLIPERHVHAESKDEPQRQQRRAGRENQRKPYGGFSARPDAHGAGDNGGAASRQVGSLLDLNIRPERRAGCAWSCRQSLQDEHPRLIDRLRDLGELDAAVFRAIR